MNQLPENSLRIYDVTLVTSYFSNIIFNRIMFHQDVSIYNHYLLMCGYHVNVQLNALRFNNYSKSLWKLLRYKQ